MSQSRAAPEPGSRSEALSAILDKAGGAAGLLLAATAITRGQFIRQAAVASHYEIDSAKIALQRAQRQEIKEFAQKMLADFEKIDSELRSFVGATNSPQAPPEQLDRVHRTMLDGLAGAANENFDRRYLDQQKIAHREALTLFKTYRRTARDHGLANLAGLALRVLEQHIEQLRALSKAA
jgi:putative membrane protein